MKCFFHKVDLDGEASGAIVLKKYPECQMIGIDRGDAFPWETIDKDEVVFIVDYSLDAVEMHHLNELSELIWIDHHKTAIEACEDLNIQGIRDTTAGACMLVWEYLYGDASYPLAVKLISDHDVWDHSDPNTWPFQYGLRLQNTVPDSDVWDKLLTIDVSFVEQVIAEGHAIIVYKNKSNAIYAKAAFELDFEGMKAIAINRLFAGSDLFDSIEKEYDLMIAFGWLNGEWKVSLRSHSKDISWIAMKYNGGGHAKACGLTCRTLPFRLPLKPAVAGHLSRCECPECIDIWKERL